MNLIPMKRDAHDGASWKKTLEKIEEYLNANL